MFLSIPHISPKNGLIKIEGNTGAVFLFHGGQGTGACPNLKNQRFAYLFPHLSLQREDGNNSSINENVDLSLVA